MTIDRPEAYNYYDQLVGHLGGNLRRVFDGTLVWPKQIEVHLPGDGRRRCNFNCAWCQGRDLIRPLGDWEERALRLIAKLGGAIPLHVFGGAYTEPLLSARLAEFVRLTKRFGNAFGIHTNGSLLFEREREAGFLTELCDLATSDNDYVSVSMDAGFTDSHCQAKNLKERWLGTIVDGLSLLSFIKGGRRLPHVRLAYLMTDGNSSPAEIANAVAIARHVGADSLRFSIPYHPYGAQFSRVRDYKAAVETARAAEYHARIAPYLGGGGEDGVPRVFWVGPDAQDVDDLHYRQCIYSYWQITLAADGYVYKCSCTASPSFPFCRLGEITDDVEAFATMVQANHDPAWNPAVCFEHGARCNRQAIELNNAWDEA